MEIRRAVTDDLEQLLDIHETVAAEGRYIGAEAPIDRERIRSRWKAELTDGTDGVVFVAEVEGKIVGSASVRGTSVAELGMSVAPGWRGKGIGSALLKACIEWARQVGAHKVSLQVWPHNEAALGLYRKFGFEQEGRLRRHWRRRNGELWDSIVMGLLLE